MSTSESSEQSVRRKALIPFPVIALGGTGLVAAILLLGGALLAGQFGEATRNVQEVVAENRSMALDANELAGNAIRTFKQDLPLMAHLLRLQEAIARLHRGMSDYLAEVGEVEAEDLIVAWRSLRDEVAALEKAWPKHYPGEVRERVAGVSAVLEDVVNEVVETDSPAQLADMAGEVRQLLDLAVQSIAELRVQVVERVSAAAGEVQAHARGTTAAATAVGEHADALGHSLDAAGSRTRLILGAVLVMVAGVQVLVFVTLRRRLGYMAGLMETLADGDVEVHVAYTSRDHLGQVLEAIHCLVDSMRHKASIAGRIAKRDLAGRFRSISERDALGGALGSMLENLNADVGRVSGAAGALDGEARQMAAGSRQLAQGAAEQAATISQIATAVDQLAQQTRRSADQARAANEAAEGARTRAGDGAGAMSRLQDSMREADEVSAEIASVVTVIDEIAFQTNLLALNATIEAARAGEAGTGFSVVAKEVRALAQRCARAAQDTSGLVARAAGSVRASGEQADQTAHSFKEIAEAVAQVAETVSEIVRASEQQASGIEEISRGLNEINEVTSQTRSVAEQNASAASSLTEQAQTLAGIVSSFKLQAAQA